MNSVIGVCFLGSILMCHAGAQTTLVEGISVQMAVASHAVEMRAADDPSAKVVAIAADGKVFVGVKAFEPAALSGLMEDMVYVKADSRVPYQRVLTVLDALRGKSVVLLTAPPQNAVKQRIVPPYGVKLVVPR